MRKAFLLLVAALLLAGCTSGNTKRSTGTTAAHSTGTAATNAEASRAPGVTTDAIELGVTYVDQQALAATGVDLELGDFKASYQALFDQINAQGGIDGRKIQPTFVAVNPIGTAPAQTACLQLTQDTPSFAILGFFLGDAVTCPLVNQNTAVVGGTQTPQLLAQAEAPWFTPYPGADVPVSAVEAFDQHKLLTGKIGVFAHVNDAGLVNQEVMPELQKLGIHATKAILDAPDGDQAAVTSGTQVIAQRFQAEGVDKVILVGDSSAFWFQSMQNQTYEPQLLISDENAVSAFLSNKTTTSTALLKNAIEGFAYSEGNLDFDDADLQACFKTLKRAGITVTAPDPNNQNDKSYTAPEDACVTVALTKALLTKAGRNLNYATFRNAGYTLGKITLPGDPGSRTYGPPPATDGTPAVHLLIWDPSKQDFVTDTNP